MKGFGKGLPGVDREEMVAEASLLSSHQHSPTFPSFPPLPLATLWPLWP